MLSVAVVCCFSLGKVLVWKPFWKVLLFACRTVEGQVLVACALRLIRFVDLVVHFDQVWNLIFTVVIKIGQVIFELLEIKLSVC